MPAPDHHQTFRLAGYNVSEQVGGVRSIWLEVVSPGKGVVGIAVPQ